MLVNVTVKVQTCVRISVVEFVLSNGSVTVAAVGAVVSVKTRFSTEFVKQLSALFVVLLLTGCDFFNFVDGTIRNADNALYSNMKKVYACIWNQSALLLILNSCLPISEEFSRNY
uniref:Uncharacterized protein n=1 Tax=Glossina pallidipes TaxID=7398 RepID=A0A1B0A358_GLOPL